MQTYPLAPFQYMAPYLWFPLQSHGRFTSMLAHGFMEHLNDSFGSRCPRAWFIDDRFQIAIWLSDPVFLCAHFQVSFGDYERGFSFPRNFNLGREWNAQQCLFTIGQTYVVYVSYLIFRCTAQVNIELIEFQFPIIELTIPDYSFLRPFFLLHIPLRILLFSQQGNNSRRSFGERGTWNEATDTWTSK